MGFSRQPSEYETVRPSRPFDASADEHADTSEWRNSDDSRDSDGWPADEHSFATGDLHESSSPDAHTSESVISQPTPHKFRRGHLISYVAFFLFTVVLLTRPSDWYENALTESLAFYLGVLTLGVFAVTQFVREGDLTARPREVYYVLALLAAGALSIPLADQDRSYAYETFMDTFARVILMFIVMVNVVRTERRLRWLLLLSLGVGIFLAGKALSDYMSGNLAVEGYRVAGSIGGMFGNPNDMSQYLVAMVAVGVGLLCTSRGLVRRAFFVSSILVLIGGIVVTFSRGGSLALTAVFFVLMWKLGKRHRLFFISLGLGLYIFFLAAAPGDYRTRLLSIFNNDLEVAGGSAASRRGLLMESVKVALRHPVFGLGMGNFRLIHKLQTHNAYTQVASEMGLLGFLAYLLFIITPIKRLREIEHATYGDPQQRKFYFMAIALQAMLIGYMVSSFFGAVAYYFNVYYLVGYAVSLRMIYYDLNGIPVAAPRLPQASDEEKKTFGRRIREHELGGAPELSAEAK